MKRIQAGICILIVIALAVFSAVPVVAFLRMPEPAVSPFWYRAISLSSLPADGVPVLLPVYAEDHDAWTKHPDRVMGQVFLIRAPETKNAKAFRQHCSRGAGIRYNAETKRFESQCFLGVSYDLNGRPRLSHFDDGMIELPVKIERDQVWIELKEF